MTPTSIHPFLEKGFWNTKSYLHKPHPCIEVFEINERLEAEVPKQWIQYLIYRISTKTIKTGSIPSDTLHYKTLRPKN